MLRLHLIIVKMMPRLAIYLLETRNIFHIYPILSDHKFRISINLVLHKSVKTLGSFRCNVKIDLGGLVGNKINPRQVKYELFLKLET